MSVLTPRDEQISQVLEIIECGDRELVRAALVAKQCDPHATIAEFFDLGLEQFRRKYGWDEAPLADGRDGQDWNDALSSSNPAPGFVIHPPDENPIIYGTEPDNSDNFYTSAGTPRPPDARPPSRANNASPRSHMRNLTTTGFNTGAPSNHQEEDEQIQRALALSLESSGIGVPPDIGPQESGVIEEGDCLPFFGPATRSEYKESEWAMTVTTGFQPQAEDPSAPSRAAEDGARFLRRRAESDTPHHLLGPFLVILHSIPSARNVLLRCSPFRTDDYGDMPEWWKAVTPPQEHEIAREPGICDNPPWADELHRLVAFLDMSARSYAAVDNLARAANEQDGDEDVETAFLNNLKQHILANHPGGIGVLFTKFVKSADAAEPENRQCVTGLFSQDDSQTPVEGNRLYEILDDMFLRPQLENNGPHWILDRPGDVVTIRIENPSKTYDIPDTLYMDRFMSGQVQVDLAKVKATIRDMERDLKEGLRWPPGSSTGRDRREVAKDTIKSLHNRIARVEASARWREHLKARAEAWAAGKMLFYLRGPKSNDPPNLTDDERKTIASLKAKIATVEQKVKNLNNNIKGFLQTLESLKNHRAYLTIFKTEEDSRASGKNLKHLYSLRGWSSSPNSCCLRRRGKTDDGHPTEQWHEMWIDTGKEYRVKHRELPRSGEETTREAVNRKLKAEFDVPNQPTSLLLVYASEEAMMAEPAPLPQTLDRFIAKDNERFASECTAHEIEQPPTDTQMEEDWYRQDGEEAETRGRNRDMMSGGLGAADRHYFGFDTRRSRGDSPDSMATNKASVGSCAGGDDRLDDVFDDTGATAEVNARYWKQQGDDPGLDTWRTPVASTTAYAGRMSLDDEFDETSSATLSPATLVGAEHIEYASPPGVPPEAPPPPRQPADMGLATDGCDVEMVSVAAANGGASTTQQGELVAELPLRGKPSDAQPTSDGTRNDGHDMGNDF